MQYHHIGVPTTVEKKWAKYVEGAKVHVTDPSIDEYGVEWLKFEPGCPMPELIQKQSHVAFVVENLDRSLAGKKVIVEPFDADATMRCAFIDHDGLAVELIQMTKKSTCGCNCGCG